MPQTSPTGSADGGFTLLELLLVLAIVGLVLALAVPRFEAASGPALADRAALLASELRAARQRAILSGRPERVAMPAQDLPGRAAGADSGTAPAVAALVFFPDGSSTGGSIVLDQDQRRMVVEVDDVTGAVRVTYP
ncbi:MAG TPA: prepilin-type N-terminal cleavage/methylation domain-containing protein [Geminicoccaceae bacterium]|nr:prepilin-type N-terminal cleavage/methylation domain-containing protein [Geminicoccaceae bacterium]